MGRAEDLGCGATHHACYALNYSVNYAPVVRPEGATLSTRILKSMTYDAIESFVSFSGSRLSGYLTRYYPWYLAGAAMPERPRLDAT